MASSPLPGPNDILLASPSSAFQPDALSQPRPGHTNLKPNQVGQVILYGIPIVSLVIDGQERLCLAQISNTLLKNFSYNEIHNRRVALGITCVQCTPVQLEILRRAGAMPISSRRCGMITKREAERLCKSFLGENRPPKLPDNFAFDVSHECAWGCRGSFIPARYNSSRAKCIKCSYCNMYFSPNKFIFHSHRTPDAKYTQPDAANFNSWRRHLKLTDKSPQDELVFAWEDVKAMFNGGSRKRALPQPGAHPTCHPSARSRRRLWQRRLPCGGRGLLGPHLLGAPRRRRPPTPGRFGGAPHAHHKRPRFDDDEDSLQEAAVVAAATALGARLRTGESPALLRQAFLDLAEPGGAGASAEAAPPPGQPPPVVANGPGSGPPPPAGGAGARDALFESPRAAAADCSAGSPPPGPVPCPDGGVAATERARGRASAGAHHPPSGGRKAGGGSYHHSSAFRPVGGKDDAESLAKLHGASRARHTRPKRITTITTTTRTHHTTTIPRTPSPLLLLPPQHDEAPHHRGLLSPGGTSCSYPSEDSSEDEDDEEEEQEVDVEGHKPPEGEEEEEEARDPEDDEEEDEETGVLLGDPLVENQKTKENNQVILSTKDDNNFSDKNKEHGFFITDSDTSGGDFWRERSGRLG
ncbi:SKI family transcriptional corepressor 2 [Camelus dromedarius]|uniref:SKI family transcriptional corepressor 2 n=1 Tax=Camelus dromedarius TaxID=9838 RepID=A0A5N4CB59_CAMDR|nr:SKI family transcriptional corepressor 2 [Camelus dromedarius]